MIGANVKQMREKVGMSQMELARRAGMPQSALARLESGGVSHPQARTIKRLADALGCAPEQLFGVAPPREPLISEPEPMRVACFKMGAGYEVDFDDGGRPVGESDTYVYVVGYGREECFAGDVAGDSMESAEARESFPPGTIVIFSRRREAVSGDFVFYRTADESGFKQAFWRDGSDEVKLRPLNPQYPEKVVKKGDLIHLWPAVQVTREIRR